MMSSVEIQKRQNEIKFLKVQYAARVCFNLAETYNHFAWFACIVSAFSIFMPNTWHEYILNGVPFAFDFAAMIFYVVASRNVGWGACLRKYFDAYVLEINSNQFLKSEEQRLCEKSETIFAKDLKNSVMQIRNTGHDNPPGVRDWYEFSKPLNGVDAQFECQKQNIWWNKKLSQRRIPMTFLAGVCVAIVFVILMHTMNRSVLNTILCSGGIVLKIIERLFENYKYARVSMQIDGSKKTIEVKPEIEYIKQLQLLIDERRGINVLESNFWHKKIAAMLSRLYSKSS